MISHEEAKAMRETDFFSNQNVVDQFKGMEAADIKKKLSSTSSDLIIVASNVIRDFNWGSVVRSANSFNIRSVIFTGRKGYDRRGAVGAHNYTNIDYFGGSIVDLINILRDFDGYTAVAAEYDENRKMTALPNYDWDKRTLLIMGEEGRGLEDDVLDAVDDIVYIPMMGSVRSLNVASAATTFMYDYSVKVNPRF